MPIAVFSAMRARLTAFCARMRSTRALATSTSARVTSDFGRVPTSKKPLALRRFSSARSWAWALTTTSRLANRRLKYCSFTASTMRSFCSSTSSRNTPALDFADCVNAHVLPKSQRSWERVIRPLPTVRRVCGDAFGMGGGLMIRVSAFWWVPSAAALSWGSMGDSAWFTRWSAAT